MAEKKKTRPTAGVSLTAGIIAGAVEGFATYPTEYIKTQLQVNPTFKSPIHVIKHTVQQAGVSGLYKGVQPLVLGNSAKAGVRFLSFNYFKDNGFGLVLSGFLSGAVEACLVVAPTETIKTKLVHDSSKQKRFKSAIHCLQTVVSEEGLGGLYRGVGAVVARQAGNSAVRMSSYSVLKESLEKRYGSLPWYWTFFCGAMAGTITVYATMPLDVAKSKLQSLDGKRYGNVLKCIAIVGREEGVRALWKGTTPRLGRLIFSGGIVFTVYESVVDAFNYIK